jgi:hypothetical protein
MKCFYLTGEIFSDNVAHGLSENWSHSAANHSGMNGLY